jgi:hypothetical protein
MKEVVPSLYFSDHRKDAVEPSADYSPRFVTFESLGDRRRFRPTSVKADIRRRAQYVGEVPFSELAHRWLPRTSLRAISGFSAAHRARKSYPGCLSAPENKCSTSRSHPFEPLRGGRLQVPRPLAFAFRHNVSPDFRRTAPPWMEHFPRWCTLHQQSYSLGH